VGIQENDGTTQAKDKGVITLICLNINGLDGEMVSFREAVLFNTKICGITRSIFLLSLFISSQLHQLISWDKKV
jgi:hypothetical protein